MQMTIAYCMCLIPYSALYKQPVECAVRLLSTALYTAFYKSRILQYSENVAITTWLKYIHLTIERV